MTHTPPIPAAFQDVLVDLPELTFSGEGTRFHQCFGCGPTHEIGLRVRCFRAAGEVLSPIVVPRRYEGPPGAVHGGIVAAYLDEVLAGAAVHHTGRLYVTGELSVRYVKPTPVERPLLGRGRATAGHAEVHRRGSHARGPRDARDRRESQGPLLPDARAESERPSTRKLSLGSSVLE